MCEFGVTKYTNTNTQIHKYSLLQSVRPRGPKLWHCCFNNNRAAVLILLVVVVVVVVVAVLLLLVVVGVV